MAHRIILAVAMSGGAGLGVWLAIEIGGWLEAASLAVMLVIWMGLTGACVGAVVGLVLSVLFGVAKHLDGE